MCLYFISYRGGHVCCIKCLSFIRSSAGTLFTPEYTSKTVQMAQEHSDFVVGFIAQRKLTDLPHMVHMTPGMK